jgi:ATP-dependent protease ClpP protease subunit
MIMIEMVGMIAFNPQNFAIYSYLKQQREQQPVSLYINSSGGVIAAAQMIAEEMSRLNVTCYVDYAASAALQVIMPSCTRIYSNPGSLFVFHSAHAMGQFELNEMSGADLVKALKTYNNDMADVLTKRYKRKDAKGCSKELMLKLSQYSQRCVVQHMLNVTQVGPLELNWMWDKEVTTVIPYIIFPRPQRKNLPRESNVSKPQ